jgi:hypothetical protein
MTMNDARIARITGAFGIACVPLLALVGMSQSGKKCGMSTSSVSGTRRFRSDDPCIQRDWSRRPNSG